MEAIRPETVDTGRGQLDALVNANARLARTQITTAHRALGVIRLAVRTFDSDAVEAVADTIVLAPGLTEQIEAAIGEELSTDWQLDVTVDSFTADLLQLTLPGPVAADSEDAIVAFLTSFEWWPSRVSVSLAGSFAIDPSAVNATEIRHLVRSVMSPPLRSASTPAMDSRAG